MGNDSHCRLSPKAVGRHKLCGEHLLFEGARRPGRSSWYELHMLHQCKAYSVGVRLHHWRYSWIQMDMLLRGHCMVVMGQAVSLLRLHAQQAHMRACSKWWHIDIIKHTCAASHHMLWGLRNQSQSH